MAKFTKILSALAASSGMIAAMPTNGTVFSVGPLSGSNHLSADQARELQNIVVSDLKQQQADYEKNGEEARARVAANFAMILSARVDMFTDISDSWLQYYQDERTKARGDDRFYHCTNCVNAINLDDIWGYGCWCVFGSDVATTKPGGQANDELDAMCKQLQLCYRCAMVDGRSEGNVCSAYDVRYDYQLTLGAGGVQMDCANVNVPGSCEYRGCTCDADFIMKMLNFDIAAVHNPLYKHQDKVTGDPIFDHAAECQVQPPSDNLERSCCGSYPDRRPYRSGADSPMKCCEAKTIYNSAYLNCCSDGSVVALGNSCEDTTN